MKKFTKFMAFVLAFLSLSLTSCQGTKPFKPGKDVATYKAAGASDYATATSAYVLIFADKDVLFSGTVTVTSDTQYAYEFFKAACEEKSLAQDGLEYGFVTSIGSYVMNTTTNTYWMWQYNGHNPTNFGVNQVHVFEGDYLQLSYEVVEW